MIPPLALIVSAARPASRSLSESALSEPEKSSNYPALADAARSGRITAEADLG
jgi:hypothetical protein